MSSNSPPLDYYAKYLFSHSPTYCRWSRLTARDIHTTLCRRPGFEGQDIWFYLNHPIRWVRVVGIVVAYDDLENRKLFTVDDGSGYTIDLISWTTAPPLTSAAQNYPPPDLSGVGLHSVVKVKGSVSEFRGVKQMLVKKVTLLKDTNEEVTAWGETSKFKREILSKPWVLSAEVVEREKRKMAGETVDEERLKDRKRRKLEKLKMAGETVDEERLKERKRRKLEKLKKREREAANGNIIRNNLIEEPGQEDRQKRKQREGRNELEVENLKKQKTDTSYRGHRRSPNSKPPQPVLEYQIAKDIDLRSISTFPERYRNIPAPAASIPAGPNPVSTFRGHRRPTPVPTVLMSIETLRKPEPEPEPEPEHKSTYRGHRRTSKPPTDVPLPSSTFKSTLSEPVSIGVSTYRGHRRTSKPPTAPDVVLPLEDPVTEISAYRDRRTSKLPPIPHTVTEGDLVGLSGGGSTYHGHQKASKPRDILTPNLIPEELLNPVQLSSAESSMYREQHRTSKSSRDGLTLTSDILPELLKPVQQPKIESTYRGRRRASKALEGGPSKLLPAETSAYNSQSRLQELTSTLLPQSSEQCTSYRDLRRLLKSQKNKETRELNEKPREFLIEKKNDDSQPERKKSVVTTETPSRSQVSGRSSYYGKRRESGPSDIQAALPSPMPSVISTYVPSQSQVPESSYRKGDMQPDTQELLEFSDFEPTPVHHSTVMEGSFRGSHRISKSQTQTGTQESFLELLEFSDFIPSPCQASALVGEGSSFRGRRRNQPVNGGSNSPCSQGFLPPSGNPSQVSSSTYRGKRRG